ncbi:hypothetical protein LPB140_06955 [Sphingorhabdus lutea]|uniref:Uncharacterized protein n=1 Tax=Sphingorhabdus lutea TaxID=1913578 RepID=A0A1L3JEW0_9SPHN|nr:hypothetical protein [Sphingorhabdus lutea]APG63677.1 hypothetical protein LPB140_06955 [Sphingorhabdus lutea]
MKIIIPNGYMLAPTEKSITVQICTGIGMAQQVIDIPMENGGDKHQNKDEISKPCPAAASAQPFIGKIDPIIFAFAFAFILLGGLLLRTTAPNFWRHYQRPPLRGPPLIT